MISALFASFSPRGAAEGWLREYGEAAVPRLVELITHAVRAGDDWTANRLDKVLQQVEHLLDAAYDAKMKSLELRQCRTS